MKKDEFLKLTTDELRKRLVDEEESLSNLRFQLATQQLSSPIRVRTVRRDIARIKTLIRQRELESAVPAAATTTETKAS
jgi:large subunit ribosomal protein L29